MSLIGKSFSVKSYLLPDNKKVLATIINVDYCLTIINVVYYLMCASVSYEYQTLGNRT